jgi:glycerol-3-phosphate dehydrogenase
MKEVFVYTNLKITTSGVQNGVEGLEIIDTQKILKIEPHLTRAIAGIWSPNTGITNYEAVSSCMAKDIIRMGGSIKLNYEVSKLEKYGVNKLLESGISVHSSNSATQPVNVQYLIACAGLYSDRLALQTGNNHSPAVGKDKQVAIYNKISSSLSRRVVQAYA